MKARRKGTNEPFQKVASVCLCSGGYILVKDVEFEQELHQLNPEEEQLRHMETIRQQTAIAAMQGLLSAPLIEGVNPNPSVAEITDLAVKLADALVEKLKV